MEFYKSKTRTSWWSLHWSRSLLLTSKSIKIGQKTYLMKMQEKLMKA